MGKTFFNNSNKKWSKEEEQLMMDLLKGCPPTSQSFEQYVEVGKLLGRSADGVRVRHQTLIAKHGMEVPQGVELPPAPVKLKTVAAKPQKQTITPAEAINIIVKHYKDAGLDAKVCITIGG